MLKTVRFPSVCLGPHLLRSAEISVVWSWNNFLHNPIKYRDLDVIGNPRNALVVRIWSAGSNGLQRLNDIDEWIYGSDCNEYE